MKRELQEIHLLHLFASAKLAIMGIGDRAVELT